MQMKRCFLIMVPLLVLWGFNVGMAQEKKSLDFDAFKSWNRVQSQKISNDGQWVTYQIRPVEGDPTLVLYHTQTEEEQRFSRGQNANFSFDSNFLSFVLKPHQDSTKAMKRRKTPSKDFPKDTLIIVDLSQNTQQVIPNVKKVIMPQKWNGWIGYHLEHDPQRFNSLDSLSKPTKNESASNGSQFVIQHLQDSATYTLNFVNQVTFSDKQKQFLLASTGDGLQLDPGVYWFDGSSTPAFTKIFTGTAKYKFLSLANKGKQATFLANRDTTDADQPPFELFYWNDAMDEAELVADRNATFLPENWEVSPFGRLSFSENGKNLFFGIAPFAIIQDKDILPEEIVNVEVWHYKDKQLYPQQNVRLKRDKEKNYTCTYQIATKKITQLNNPQIPNIILGKEGDGSIALGFDESPYLRAVSWEGGPSRKDLYLINTNNGESTKIATGIKGNPNLSPQAKYVYWYDLVDSVWMAYDIEGKATHQLTKNLGVAFYNELNDSPNHPWPYGMAGWTTNDDFIMLYDRYDIWMIDPKGYLKANNLTRSRADKKRMRYINIDPEAKAIEEVSKMLFHFFDETSKEEGYLWYDLHTTLKTIVQKGGFRFSTRPIKAKNADAWVFTKQNYQTFPDLQFSTDLKQTKQISTGNPQQADYNWGNIELYKWTSLDGQELSGLLVKPDNFDPNKKYPMIVNFYERNSDRLHLHRPPYPNRSQITYAFYASRDYIIFNPDIPYRIGYPGESAYNAVVSGVSALIDEGFVDRSNIGVQGHSWGGYQIAYLLTKTDLFKCAEAGAPVVNMVSAYGGIRWGSGLSRMFQYEHTQSRIGGTLWEKPLRYLENSPIFSLDKVNTPVLILHNDKDGAVPWYQGIEYFVGLRRLNKPAWMLNYNGEPHWPLKLQNRIDFQMRMAQFFDHFLKGQPMPKWMQSGVPAIEKGIRQGFEYKP